MRDRILSHCILWCLLLGCANWALKRYAVRFSDSKLARQVEGGAFNAPVYAYIVTVCGQCMVQLPLWTWMWVNRNELWWFGAGSEWAIGAFLGYSAGYFVQDAVSNWNTSSGLLLLHHAAAVLSSLIFAMSNCWRGLLVTVAMTFELGSLALSLADLCFMSQQLATWIFTVSTLLPMVWLVQGVITSAPCDLIVGYNSFAGFIAGALRLKEAFERIRPNKSMD